MVGHIMIGSAGHWGLLLTLLWMCVVCRLDGAIGGTISGALDGYSVGSGSSAGCHESGACR